MNMTGTTKSSFLEVGSLLTSPRPFLRSRFLSKSSQSADAQKRGYGSVSSLRRLSASSDPDPPSSGSLPKVLEDFDSDKLVKDLKGRWDKVEDKTSFSIYVGGAVLLLFVASSVVSAFDSLPLLPKLFQLVGLIYSAWFVYRYLLFKSSRQELIDDVNELKKKISGER